MENHIYTTADTIKYFPLWYHTKGLQQTASGYGSKLNTGYKVLYSGKWYRLYAHCYSNNGTTYIIVKGQTITVS